MGFGSHCITFGPHTPGENITEILRYFDRVVRRQHIRHTQQISRKADNEVKTYKIPTIDFYLAVGQKVTIRVRTLFNASHEVVGWEFWTCGWLYGTSEEYDAMMIFLESMQSKRLTAEVQCKA